MTIRGLHVIAAGILLASGTVLAGEFMDPKAPRPDDVIAREEELSMDRAGVLIRAAFPGQEVQPVDGKFRVHSAGGVVETVDAGIGKCVSLVDGGCVEWLQVFRRERWRKLADDATAGKFGRPKDTIRLVFACTPKGGKTEFLMRSYDMGSGEIERAEIVSLLGDGRLQAVVKHSSVAQPAADVVEVDAAFNVIALPDGKVIFSSPTTNAKSIDDEDAAEYEFDYRREAGAKEFEIQRIDPKVGDHEWEVFRYRDGEYRPAGKGVDKEAVAQLQSLAAWAAEEGKRMDAELRWAGPERVTGTPAEWLCGAPGITTELKKEERLELVRLAFPKAEVREVPLVPMGEMPDLKALAGESYAKDVPKAKAALEVKEEGKPAHSEFLVCEGRVDIGGGRATRFAVFQARGADSFSASVLGGQARKTPMARPLVLAWQLLEGDKTIGVHRQAVSSNGGLAALSGAPFDLSDPSSSFSIIRLPGEECAFMLHVGTIWPVPAKGAGAYVYETRQLVISMFDGTVLLDVPVLRNLNMGCRDMNAPARRVLRVSKDDLSHITLEGGPGEETYVYAFTHDAYRLEKSYMEKDEEVEPEGKSLQEALTDNVSVDLNLLVVNSQSAPVPGAQVEMTVETGNINLLTGDEDTHEQEVEGKADKNGRYQWKGKASGISIVVKAPGYPDTYYSLEDKEQLRDGRVELALLTEEEAASADVLLKELQQKSAARRECAIECIRSLGPQAEGCVEAVIKALKDPSSRVRRRAIDTLEVLGDERAIEPLREFLKDGKDPLGVIAKMAIDKIRNSAAKHR